MNICVHVYIHIYLGSHTWSYGDINIHDTYMYPYMYVCMYACIYVYVCILYHCIHLDMYIGRHTQVCI